MGAMGRLGDVYEVSGPQVSVPPLTAQEKVVVGEIKRLLAELEQALDELGGDPAPQADLLHLSADILRQSVEDRSRSLLVARDRYAQELLCVRDHRQHHHTLRVG